jgi:hypothetical protein
MKDFSLAKRIKEQRAISNEPLLQCVSRLTPHTALICTHMCSLPENVLGSLNKRSTYMHTLKYHGKLHLTINRHIKNDGQESKIGPVSRKVPVGRGR